MSETVVVKNEPRQLQDNTCMMKECRSKDMDMWPLLSLVAPSLQSKINLVFVFGSSGTEMMFTTVDDNVGELRLFHSCSTCLLK